ncbi:MAG: aminomethyltransferase family protein, partial [Thermohalobaculum sp.]|nr:aminomethyltransferase family protein [Thermohalobaculum sp.]
ALVCQDVAMEHSAIRNAATLYDLCPMIKYRIEGPQAVDYLNRLTLRDAGKLAVGAVHYTAWTDDRGRLLDDGTLFRLAPERFRLCCQERHLPWLLDSAWGFDVRITDETEAVAALSLQGPLSATVLAAMGVDVSALRPFRLLEVPFGAGRLTISRTGFTADLGYELWFDPGLALPLWDRLEAAGAPFGLRPIGSEALNIARIEAGFIVTHLDFTPADQAVREDRARSPLEMGLDWMIDWDKGHFTGRRALAAQRARGPTWAFVGLDIAGNVPAEGALLYRDRRHEAGVVTAAVWSPTLKRNIALAQVRRRYLDRRLWAEIYAQRELHHARMMVRATPAARPFFNPARRRATPPGRV